MLPWKQLELFACPATLGVRQMTKEFEDLLGFILVVVSCHSLSRSLFFSFRGFTAILLREDGVRPSSDAAARHFEYSPVTRLYNGLILAVPVLSTIRGIFCMAIV